MSADHLDVSKHVLCLYVNNPPSVAIDMSKTMVVQISPKDAAFNQFHSNKKSVMRTLSVVLCSFILSSFAISFIFVICSFLADYSDYKQNWLEFKVKIKRGNYSLLHINSFLIAEHVQ